MIHYSWNLSIKHVHPHNSLDQFQSQIQNARNVPYKIVAVTCCISLAQPARWIGTRAEGALTKGRLRQTSAASPGYRLHSMTSLHQIFVRQCMRLLKTEGYKSCDRPH